MDQAIYDNMTCLCQIIVDKILSKDIEFTEPLLENEVVIEVPKKILLDFRTLLRLAKTMYLPIKNNNPNIVNCSIGPVKEKDGWIYTKLIFRYVGEKV